MVKKIKWNRAADKNFDAIAYYLQTNYSTQSAENFHDLVYNRIDQIAKGLTVGRLSSKSKTVLVLKLDNHKQMYYRLAGTTLIIVDFWDTRQNPEKKPF